MIGGYLEFSKGFSPRMHFSETAKLCHTCFDKWTLLTDNQTVSSNISLSDDLLICKNENIKNPWKKILAPLAQSVQDLPKVKKQSQQKAFDKLTPEEKLKILDETIVLNENLESVGLGVYCFWDKESDRLLREAIIQSINLKTM